MKSKRSWFTKFAIKNQTTNNISRLQNKTRISFEVLEGRALPNAYIVNIAGDNSGSVSGAGSGNTGDLRYVMANALADATPDTIAFDPTAFTTSQTITLSSSLVTMPASFNNVYGQTAFIIGNGDNISIDGSLGNGSGITLDGGFSTRLFAVQQSGTLNLNNLTIAGGNAVGTAGGSGAGGGGGGAGLGGAIFVEGTLSVFNSTIRDNVACGGLGGGISTEFTGGGGGAFASPPAGNGGASSGGNGAGPNGGAGGSFVIDGSTGGYNGGGGGGGDGDNFLLLAPGNGGTGGFGGGGGGAGSDGSGGYGYGGAGGFGGGGGGSSIQFSAGGFGGGYGGGGTGGGGAGLGGAIFSNGGTITLVNDTFFNNAAQGGVSIAGGTADGVGYGGAVFAINGALTAQFVTFVNNSATDATDIYVLGDVSDAGVLGGASAAQVTLNNNILFQSSGATSSNIAFFSISGGMNPSVSAASNLVSNNTPNASNINATGLINGVTVGQAPIQMTPANNGGNTQTFALTQTTPGVDIVGIGFDQRGVVRTTPPDIGSYQFTPAAPAVSAISAHSGPAAGGTVVTIVGTNFTGASFVNFGSIPSLNFVVDSDTQIIAAAPAGTGTVDITVTTAGGTSVTSANDLFTYIASPVVSSLSVTSGPLAGGSTVIIEGSNFNTVSDVRFGSTAATSFVINSNSQITAVVPTGNQGTVDVTVTSIGGTSSPSAGDKYRYIAAPLIVNVTPASGPVAGGTEVEILGGYFTGVTDVKFGGNSASFTFINDYILDVVAPAGVVGTVDITVTSPGGTSTVVPFDHFTYVSAPNVIGISPSSGPLAGSTVAITGTNFTAATEVLFGSQPATSFSVISDTEISAVAPVGIAGTVDVTVTTAGGTSAILNADQYTYFNPPEILTLGATSGSTAGGNTVAIYGSHFTPDSQVFFGSIQANSVTVNNDGLIVVTAPAGVAGLVDVTVVTAGGTSAITASDKYTYVTLPAVNGIGPVSGPLSGTTVAITGSNFTGATSVMFGNLSATSFIVASDTYIEAIAPAGTAGVVDVRVSTVGGTSAIVSGDQFTYLAAPVISSIAPIAGPVGGGTSVVITGSNFTGATNVTFGNIIEVDFTVDSDTQITAIAPLSTAGTVDVTVTSAGGTSEVVTTDKFTYVAAPVITSVTPAVGPLSGGNSVVIAGSSFTGATLVLFGSTPSTSFIVDSDGQITAVAPTGILGTVDITIVGVGGTSEPVATDSYVYVAAPVVGSVSPSAAPLSGGIVVIAGSNFIGATSVLFGNSPATSFTIDSDNQITAVAPSGVAGTVHITVKTAGGTSAVLPSDAYTYVAAPYISSISATSVSLGGGIVVISGSHFTGATSVLFGNSPATSFTIDMDGQITAIAPVGVAGTVDITVTTIGGTSEVATTDQFTYVAAPSVSSIAPFAGPLAGTTVVIKGTHFNGATEVFFGSTPATSFKIDSDDQITAVAPAGVAGSVDITVTTIGGTSEVVATGTFKYIAAPTVSSVSPASAPLAGSTVVIKGSHFNGATEVRFGASPATSFTIDSDGQITAVAPAGIAGSVDITVTTTGGRSEVVTAGAFNYIAAPIVSSVSPSSGPLAGTTVVITGSHFNGATSVLFGNTPATSFTIDSDGKITAVAPTGVAGIVDITVTTIGGTSTISTNDHFAYNQSIAPNTVISSNNGTVTILNPDGTTSSTVTPIPGYSGPLRTTIDSTGRVVAGTGPGVSNVLTVLDPVTNQTIFSANPFETSFTGGLLVASADFFGSGVPDIIVSADNGGGTRVQIRNGRTGAVEMDFFGIDDPNFRGGTRVTTGDINGDSVSDLIVAAGTGGGPRVSIYDGTALASKQLVKIADFFAFEPSMRNGIYISAGDFNNDGHADVVTGGGIGAGPRVQILSGKDITSGLSNPTILGNFFAGDPDNRDGVQVVAKNLDGDTIADLIAAPGGANAIAYAGKTITPSGTPPVLFTYNEADSAVLNGIFVG